MFLGDGVRSLRLDMSHVPFDSLDEVATAAARGGTARIRCEPVEYDLRFDAARVRVVFYPRGRRRSTPRVVWECEGGAPIVWWRALRRLESRFDAAHWTHAFPAQRVADLLTSIRSPRARPPPPGSPPLR